MDKETLDLGKLSAKEIAVWHRDHVSCGGTVQTFMRKEDRRNHGDQG
jgi:hypothetical protein